MYAYIPICGKRMPPSARQATTPISARPRIRKAPEERAGFAGRLLPLSQTMDHYSESTRDLWCSAEDEPSRKTPKRHVIKEPSGPSGTLNRSNVDRAAGQVLALPVISHVKLTPFGSSCNRAAESAGGQLTRLESTLRAWVSDTGRDAAGGLRHTDRRGGALPDLQLLWGRGR